MDALDSNSVYLPDLRLLSPSKIESLAEDLSTRISLLKPEEARQLIPDIYTFFSSTEDSFEDELRREARFQCIAFIGSFEFEEHYSTERRDYFWKYKITELDIQDRSCKFRMQINSDLLIGELYKDSCYLLRFPSIGKSSEFFTHSWNKVTLALWPTKLFEWSRLRIFYKPSLLQHKITSKVFSLERAAYATANLLYSIA